MFCITCGSKIKSAESKFCAGCGNLINPEAQVQQYIPQPAMPKKSRRSIRGVLLTVFIVGAMAVGGIFIGLHLTGFRAMSAAMNNLNREIDTRLETTPFQAFGMLMSALEHGTVIVDVDYTREWESGWWDWNTGVWHDSGWNRDDIRFQFELASNAQARRYALTGFIDGNGSTANFSAHLNRDMFAVGSRQFDSGTYYGFRFDTFSNGFRDFGRDIGLSSGEINQVIDFVDIIAEGMRDDRTASDELDEYIQPLINILLSAEQVTDRVDITAGGQIITNARRISYIITDDDVFTLLHEWIDIFEADDRIRDAFNNDMFGNIHRDAVREMRNAMREMERYFSGSATLALYIGNGNRLVRVDLVADIRFDHEDTRIEASIDFGANATDTWHASMIVEGDFDRYELGVIWTIRERGDRYIHELEFYSLYGNGAYDRFTLISDWNPANGNFDIRFFEEWRWNSWDGVWRSGSSEGSPLTGNFTTDGETFALRFEYSDNWYSGSEAYIVNISTIRTANIPATVDFIDVANWDSRLIDRLDDFFWDLGW